jgi:hypothetical protein
MVLYVLERVRQRVVVRLRLVGHHIVRLDVHGEPAFGGAIGDPWFLQRIGRARPLQDDEAGVFLPARRVVRLRDLRPDVSAGEVVHLRMAKSTPSFRWASP